MLGNATVGAVTEAERVLRRSLAVHVELVGVGEDVLITVGRVVGGNVAIASLDMLLADDGDA